MHMTFEKLTLAAGRAGASCSGLSLGVGLD